jgi:peptidoglycan/xylan/chitin deacetylase (PgdA/CDA1 family)
MQSRPTAEGVTANSTTLDRLLLPVNSSALDAQAGDGSLTWLTAADGWRILVRPRETERRGEELMQFALPSGENVSAYFDADEGVVRIPFDFDEAYRGYVTEEWRTYGSLRALSTKQLQLYYAVKRVIPREWLLSARRVFVRRAGLPDFPKWPLDESVDRLLHFYALCLLTAGGSSRASFRWFWPRSNQAALMLTHDVESAVGLRLAIEIADLEEARGLRSSFNIVGEEYPIDMGIVRELDSRGFEIGLHGLHHDRSLFSSRAEFERQQPGMRDAARKLGAVGFRSPSTHRVVEWLPELPVSYDGTMFHSDPYEPQPGGCCTLWPFRLGPLIELPYTLPQDHTLFTLLRERSAQTWLTLVDAIGGRYGLIHCLSHPDPGYLGESENRKLYVEFLDAVAERSGLWRALPRDIASWWHRRETADPSDADIELGTMRRDGSSVVFEPPDAGVTAR